MESLKGPKVLSRLRGTTYRNVALQKGGVTIFRTMEVFAILHLYYLSPNVSGIDFKLLRIAISFPNKEII